MSKQLHKWTTAHWPAFLLLALLALLPTKLQAAIGDTFEIDNLKYTVTSEDKKEVSVGQGSSSPTGKLTIPSAVTKDETEYSVTSIGDDAFRDCRSLSSIDIPNSVTSIGDRAFQSCSALTSIIIPNLVTSIGDDAFNDCSNLISIDIPNSVTSIGDKAFSSCRSLSSIDIPNSVTSIGDYAFSSCRSLTSIIIPNSVTSIGNWAFTYCRSLTSIIIPNSVTSIGNYAFSYCTGLIKSAYPSSIKNPFESGIAIEYPADNSLFEDDMIWSADKSVIYFASHRLNGDLTIPASVTSIAENAFTGCYELAGIKVEAITAPTINDNSFDGLYTTCTLNVPDEAFIDYAASNWNLFKTINGNVAYDNGNFIYRYSVKNKEGVLVGPSKTMSEATILAKISIDGAMYDVKTVATNAFKGKNLTKVTFREGIETIGAYAFYGNKIASLELPSSMKTIGEYAFYGNKIASLELSSSMKTIGEYAFYNNPSMTKAFLGENLETICDFAFGATNIYHLVIPNSVKTIGKGAFANITTYDNVDRKNCYYPEIIDLGTGVEKIGDIAFVNKKISTLKIPASVKEIGEYAFANSYNLENIEIESGLEIIGLGAFRQCSGLATVGIPETVKSIGDQAFYNSAITDVNIPTSVEAIGKEAFSNCTKLTKVTIADGVNAISIGNSAFAKSANGKSVYIGRNFTGYSWIVPVSSLVIGNTVTEIPGSAFAGTYTLQSLTLGSSLSEIPFRAFEDCALSEVVVPSNVTTIGKSAFADNNPLTKVIIGCGTATIGSNAFANNNNIATISVTAVEPPVASDDVFTTQNAKLNVIKDSREAYENASCWYQFEGADLVPITVFNILGEPVPTSSAANATDNQIQFTATVEPANASLKDYIFWESSDPEVATVDNNGLVTIGNKEGKAEITARTLYADVLATATVTSDGNVEAGIDDIFNDVSADSVRPNDIYNLQGVCLKRNATQADIDALAPGLYIIAGKKVIMK